MTAPNCNDGKRQRRPAGPLLMKTLEHQSGPMTLSKMPSQWRKPDWNYMV